jgi:thioredoxin reductase (NADPH)
VLSGPQPGGQLTTTTLVENFPGFPEGVMGPDLMSNMQKQAEHFGAKVLYESAVDIDVTTRPFKIQTDTAIYEADGVIIATGASARYLGLPDESRFVGRGYHTCATCDGFFYKNKNVIVVGGGDTAMEEAHHLAKLAASVTIVHRRDTFRASKIMQDRVLKDPKIKVMWNTVIKELVGEKKVEKVILEETTNQKITEMPVDGVFVAIGYDPNVKFVQGKIDMNEFGYLVPKHHTASNIPGIFIAGDVEDAIYRQAITAAGDGCKAALDCERWLGMQ